MALPETQSWRCARVGGDSSVPTARWSPPFFPLPTLCGVAWPPVGFLRMSGNDASAGDGHRQGLPRLGDAALADFVGITRDSGDVMFPMRWGRFPILVFPPCHTRCHEASDVHRAHSHMKSGGALAWSCRIAPGPIPSCLWVWVWVWMGVGVCVCQEPCKCYVRAKLFAVCPLCTDLVMWHLWYRGVEEWGSLLFLPERKGELCAPGVQLLGRVGSFQAHIPPACPASSGAQSLCASEPPCRLRSRGAWHRLVSLLLAPR